MATVGLMARNLIAGWAGLNRREKWVLVLLVSGWVLPTVLPPSGIPVAAKALEFPVGDERWAFDDCWLIHAGFFSQGAVIESRWEGFYGHSFPDVWPIGFLPGALAVIGAVCVLFSPRSRKVVIGAYLLLLAGIIVCPFWFLPSLALRSSVKGSLLLFGLVLSILLSIAFGEVVRRGTGHDRMFNWACRVLLLHFLWLFALMISYRLMPFLGWAASFAGTVVLITTPKDRVRVATCRPDVVDYLCRLLLIAFALIVVLFPPCYRETMVVEEELKNGSVVRSDTKVTVSEDWEWRFFWSAHRWDVTMTGDGPPRSADCDSRRVTDMERLRLERFLYVCELIGLGFLYVCLWSLPRLLGWGRGDPHGSVLQRDETCASGTRS